MLSTNVFDNAIALIEKLNEPWGIKDAESRHVYLNPHARKFTNTPNDFSYEGKFDVEFPASWHELHDDLIKHDQKAMIKKSSVSVLEVHFWNGNSKPTPYISNKVPIYAGDNNCIGIMWNAKPASIINPIVNLFKVDSCKVLTYGIDEITEKEHEVIYLLIQGYTRKEVSRILNVSSRTVNFRLHSVYQKKSIYNMKQLRDFYIENGYKDYIPSSILRNGVHFYE